MKKSFLVALAVAVLVAPSASAVTGSVAVSSVATDAVCDGVSNVTITVQTEAPPPESAPLDLVIAIDDSGSMNAAEFTIEKNAAVAFVNGLDFTGGVRQVGVIAFSDFARTIVGLSNDKTMVVNAIDGMVHEARNTNITDAIRDARSMLTGPGSQPAADKVLLVMTDGQNNRETSQFQFEINAFKNMPGEIFALGFGNGISLAQLNLIASDPDSSHVFVAPTVADLEAIATEIAETIQNPAATDVELDALVAAPFTAVAGSESADAGTVVPIAGGFQWLIPSLGTETRSLSFQVMHSGNEDAMFAALSSLSGTFLDSEGNTEVISATSPVISVSGCNDPPAADAGADQSVSLSGSSTAAVSLDGSASSDPDPQDVLTYSWSELGVEIATGPTPAVDLGLGSHLITLTVSDGRLSDSDDVVITISDPTPPSITAHVTGTPGNSGWYTSDVGISWTVVDLESEVTTSGCDPSSVTSDTAAIAVTCSATSAGGSSAETVTVKRDATSPVVQYSGHQPSYDISDTINITCSASDALSGLASSSCADISGPATSFLGPNTASATAVDNAGNSTTTTITFTVTPTAAALCTLVQEYVDHPAVAHALCRTLEKGQIHAFMNQVNAHRGKRLTNEQADLLIRLAGML